MKKLVLLVWVFITVIACNNSSNKNLSPSLIENPASANGDKKNIKVAKFEFEESKFHFGEVKEGDILTHVFKFKNAGETDLVITDVATSCGCTVANYSKDPVKPGESGHVDVQFNSEQKSGMVSKTVTVLANTIPATKVLTISAEIYPR